MVPTPSQLSGPLSHYKKFWILQTQLADSAASSSSCHIPPAATATAAVNNSCDHSNNNIQLHRHSCSTTTSSSSSKQLVDAWKLPKQETFPSPSDAPRISSGRLFSGDKGVIIGSTLAAAPFNPAHVHHQYNHRLYNPSCAAASSPLIYTDSGSYAPANIISDKPGEAHSIDRASDEVINPLNASEESINLSEKYVRSGMKLAACAASDRSSSLEQSSQEYECDRDGHRHDESEVYDDEVDVDHRQQMNSSGFYFNLDGNNSIPITTASISAGSSLQSRSCTLCGTTKTPLWRSGPQGPKSLCNACGIRVKKAKRLQEAAAAAERMNMINGSAAAVIKTGSASVKPLLKKRKLSEHANAKERLSKGAMKTVKQRLNLATHHKKINPSSSNIITTAKHGADSLSQLIESNQGSSTTRLISTPQSYAKDEEEAAVLLMALSCGLVLA